jgi:hypothetical protein
MKQDLSKNNKLKEKYDFESGQNLIGFFNMLYEINK